MILSQIVLGILLTFAHSSNLSWPTAKTRAQNLESIIERCNPVWFNVKCLQRLFVLRSKWHHVYVHELCSSFFQYENI